ncbi:MAG: tRNA pseudouridine(55) synthase TruB [Bdellovibrionales bacterium CG10_big_fil_rev_8_21_14_0_10_45_34]|nr:MAG: tRNA pseudouridine(55) synthase TruB [Bdellovibrionales bacterium CG10_big_fil_rev_8_21_14_0_10_45_34]
MKSKRVEDVGPSGVLLVDKPIGLTSHDVVQRVRRVLNTRSVGHAGTLDPLASGLLVLLVGEGTKLSDYLLTGDKSYVFDVQLGLETTTFDMEGEVVKKTTVSANDIEKFRQKVEEFKGELDLKVPAYSAVKVNGKKLYELARAGQHTPDVVKRMIFKDVSFEEVEGQSGLIRVTLTCSKGSFVRSWAHEIGQAVGTGAAVVALRRVGSFPFEIGSTVKLADFESMKLQDGPQVLENGWIPLGRALPHWPQIRIRTDWIKRLRNGQIPFAVVPEIRDLIDRHFQSRMDIGVRMVEEDTGALVSIIQKGPKGGFQIKRVFNSSRTLTAPQVLN